MFGLAKAFKTRAVGLGLGLGFALPLPLPYSIEYLH